MGIVAIGVLIVAFLIWWSSRPVTFDNLIVKTEQPAGADGMAWGGPEGAAVVIQEFSDFGCGHCANFANDTEPTLIERYADNPNVRFEYKTFVLGPTTMDAAVGAACAAQQDLFWPFHNTLFANQSTIPDIYSQSNVKQIAAAIGANTRDFNSCFDGGGERRAVNAMTQEGRDLGINSTPMFFVNGELIQGNQPLSVFITAIDAALVAAGLQ